MQPPRPSTPGRPPGTRREDSRGGDAVALGLPPGDRPREPLVERRAPDEPEALASARRLEPTAKLAVGTRGVPDDPSLEAGDRGDLAGQVADRDLLSRPDVDRLRPVIALGSQRDRVRGVVDIEELACG